MLQLTVLKLKHQLFVRKDKRKQQWKYPCSFSNYHEFLIGDDPGRPKVYISQDTLVYFTLLGFKWNYIGDMFLVPKEPYVGK